MNHRFRMIMGLVVLFLPIKSLAAANPLFKENLAYQWLTQNHLFFHHLNFNFSPFLAKHLGASYRLEYSLGPQAIDLQGSFLSSSWRALSVNPSDAHALEDNEGIISDPASEISRTRGQNDPFSQWMASVGYSYRGRLVPISAKTWMQSARFSVGYTGVTDTNRSLKYSGFFINAEFSILMTVSSKILAGPTMGYRHGWVHLDGKPASNMTRLPIATLEAGLGIVF